MAELKEGWNGPMTLTVKISGPKGVAQDGSGTQWKGKYPPHKDVLQWDTLFAELGNTKITVCSPAHPETGTVYADAYIHVEPNKNKPEYPFRTMYTKEEKEQKSQGGGGGFKGSGAKPNYSLEQEAMRDALHYATLAFSGPLEKDGKTVPATVSGIEALADKWQKKILEVGKKPETTQL